MLAVAFSTLVTQIQAQVTDHEVRVPGSAMGDWVRNGQSVKLVSENIRGGVSKPDQIVAIDGPTGQACHFTDYYFWLPMRQNPAGLGKTWTASLWVRVDDGDWGTYRLPWNSNTNVSRKYATIHQVLVSVQDPFKPFWQLRVFNQRLELVMNNAWTVMGSTRFVPGRWTHVAAVRDEDRVRLFIDGQPEPLQAAIKLNRDTGALAWPSATENAAVATGAIPGVGQKAPASSALLVIGNQHDDAAPEGGQFVGGIGGFSLVDRIDCGCGSRPRRLGRKAEGRRALPSLLGAHRSSRRCLGSRGQRR